MSDPLDDLKFPDKQGVIKSAREILAGLEAEAVKQGEEAGHGALIIHPETGAIGVYVPTLMTPAHAVSLSRALLHLASKMMLASLGRDFADLLDTPDTVREIDDPHNLQAVDMRGLKPN